MGEYKSCIGIRRRTSEGEGGAREREPEVGLQYLYRKHTQTKTQTHLLSFSQLQPNPFVSLAKHPSVT